MSIHINGQPVTLDFVGPYWVASVGPYTSVTCGTAVETMGIVSLLLTAGRV